MNNATLEAFRSIAGQPAVPGYLPRNGYRGWVCTCGAKAQRGTIPTTFVCERPTCESQHAEWIDEAQS